MADQWYAGEPAVESNGPYCGENCCYLNTGLDCCELYGDCTLDGDDYGWFRCAACLAAQGVPE